MVYSNFASLMSKGGSAEAYNGIIDSISRKEDIYRSDSSGGSLSPGDLKNLISEIEAKYASPSLSPTQRSNLLVKKSEYEKQLSILEIKNKSDLSVLDRGVKDDHRKNLVKNITNPLAFAKKEADTKKAKYDSLLEEFQRAEEAFDDTTKIQDELEQAKLEALDAYDAFLDVQNGNVDTNYAAYTVTNSYGEVVDMKIEKIGNRTDYLPTNGTYGGIPIYGKINRMNEWGQKEFVLGNQKFVESEQVISGADAISFVKVLALEGSSSGGEAPKVEVSFNTLRSQNELRRGNWGLGQNGSLYQRQENGNYKKFVNTSKEELGLKDGDIWELDTITEEGINPYVEETIDKTPVPPVTLGEPADQAIPAGPPQIQTQIVEPGPKGRPNTGGAPEVRSPQDASGTATGVMGGIKNFLGSLFGK